MILIHAHFFICLMANWIASYLKGLLIWIFYLFFYIVLSFFLICRSILDMGSLSVICLWNIFTLFTLYNFFFLLYSPIQSCVPQSDRNGKDTFLLHLDIIFWWWEIHCFLKIEFINLCFIFDTFVSCLKVCLLPLDYEDVLLLVYYWFLSFTVRSLILDGFVYEVSSVPSPLPPFLLLLLFLFSTDNPVVPALFKKTVLFPSDTS